MVNHSEPRLTRPELAGLAWRPLTQADLEAVVALAVEIQQSDGGLTFLAEPDYQKGRYFPDAPGATLGAFDAQGRLAASAAVYLSGAADTEHAKMVGQVRPDQRRRGIGSYFMRWSQAQAQTLFAASTPNRHLVQIATEALTEPAHRLYAAHGFTSTFEELVMQRDLTQPLPDHPLPPSMTLTAWQPDLANQFFRAYEDAFRERPGFPGYSAEEWILDWNENENALHDWSLLARAGEVPAGFVLASAERPGGYIVQVGVVPAHRRRGLASALMVESLRRMQAAGKPAVQLAVHLNNPGAIQTYRELGFREAGQRARYERAFN